MIKKVVEIDVQADDAIQDINSINKGIKNVDESAKKAEDSTQDLSASAVDGAKNFKFMGVSINSVSKSLKVLRVSLIATGIGAIVVAVGALAAAFLSTQKGIDKLNSVLIPLKEVLETVWGIAQRLGEGLFKIVSGDVKEGFDQIKSSVKGVGDELTEAVKRGRELYDLQIQIRENSVRDGLVISRLNRLREEQLAIAEDITVDEEKRRTAFRAAIAAEEAIFKLRKRENEQLIEKLKLEQQANDTDAEGRKELNDLIAQGETIEAEFLKRKTNLTKRLNTVKVEGVNIEAEKQRVIQAQIESSAAEVQLVQDTEDQKLAIQGDALAERLLLENKANKILGLQEEELQKQKISIISQTFGAIADILGENSAVGKAAAIAQATINTYQGITEVWKTPSTLPEPFATISRITSTASVLASGLSAVKSIKSQQLPSGAGGGGISTSSPPQAVAPDFNIAGSSGINQIADIVGEQVNKPVKAFVVSNEVTTGQALDRSIVGTAGIG